MREVELLYELEMEAAEAVALLAQWTFIGIFITDDVYFSHPNDQRLSPTEDGNVEASLRLRRQNGSQFLTLKRDHFDESRRWTHSDEYEVNISDVSIGEQILNGLGYRRLVTVTSKKHQFVNERLKLNIEEVEGLGHYIEIESQDETRTVSETRRQLIKILQATGIRLGCEQTLGKPQLLLLKRRALPSGVASA